MEKKALFVEKYEKRLKKIFEKAEPTFIRITPGSNPMRCSMDWTQEPQVIPTTPRETEHRLTFCGMIAFFERTQKGENVLSNIKLQVLGFRNHNIEEMHQSLGKC